MSYWLTIWLCLLMPLAVASRARVRIDERRRSKRANEQPQGTPNAPRSRRRATARPARQSRTDTTTQHKPALHTKPQRTNKARGQAKRTTPDTPRRTRRAQADAPPRSPHSSQKTRENENSSGENVLVDYQRLFRFHQSHTRVAARTYTKRSATPRVTRKRPQTVPRAEGSQVQPGPRRIVVEWLHQGRLVSLLLFVAAAGCLGYLFTSDDLHVRQIHVEGNSVLTDEHVAQLSGLHGLSIWFLDSSAALERLYQNAYVEEATMQIALPDQVVLHISERKPEVRWQIGSVQYLVDASGKVLDQAQEPPDTETLVIVDTGNPFLEPNDQVDPDALMLASALALRLPVELGFTPTIIGWDKGTGVYVQTSAEQTIIFGRTENLDRKLKVLQHLLTDQTPFTYLDLRPSNPFYR